MLSVMEVKSTRILPCAMSNAACAAMRMTPEDAICFTSCCFRWDCWICFQQKWLRKEGWGSGSVAALDFEADTKFSCQRPLETSKILALRNNLICVRTISYGPLPFDPFLLFCFLYAILRLCRPHQSDHPWRASDNQLLQKSYSFTICFRCKRAVLLQALILNIVVRMT